MLKDISVKTSNFNKLSGTLFLFFLLLGFSFFHPATRVCAQTENAIDNVPLHITSDKMIALKESSMVEFIGNVKAIRVDSIILADSIKVFFNTDKKKDAQSSVKEIISAGNVHYTAGERQAFADKAVFTTKDEILVLTGKSPKLITGSSFVTGKKITLFRKLDKVLVESDGSKRVEAVFNPEDSITE